MGCDNYGISDQQTRQNHYDLEQRQLDCIRRDRPGHPFFQLQHQSNAHRCEFSTAGGCFEFVIKTPETRNENLKAWLRKAVESTFGVTARRETRETDVFVLNLGQATVHLTKTVATGGSSMSSGGGSLNCVYQSMTSLARSLESILKKPVIDETGLTNGYDFQLLWDEKETGEMDPGELTGAIREQLGLALVPAKRAVDFLIVTVANRSRADQHG